MVRQTLLPNAGRRFDELSDHQRIRTEELHSAQKLSPNISVKYNWLSLNIFANPPSHI